MPDAEALLFTIDAAASGFTLCRLAPGVQLAGTAFTGVSALQVLEGSMRLTLPHGEVRVVGPGHLVLIPGGTLPLMAYAGAAVERTLEGHRCLVRRGGWLVADATGGRVATLLVAAARMTGTTEQSLRSVLVARPADLPEGRQALAMLRAEVARSSPGSNTLAVILMSACVVIGLRSVRARAENTPSVRAIDTRASIERAIGAVRARPADPHDIDSLARAAGMSRSSLTRYFRKTLGTTPTAFVQRARLTEAAALLRSTDLPVKAVAAAAGFASRSHFSQVFAAAFGADPTTFRTTPEPDSF